MLDFTPITSRSVTTYRAETTRRRYIITKAAGTNVWTATVVYRSRDGNITGECEDVFRGAASFNAAARACHAHYQGRP
jgi:hypothetical protein